MIAFCLVKSKCNDLNVDLATTIHFK